MKVVQLVKKRAGNSRFPVLPELDSNLKQIEKLQ